MDKRRVVVTGVGLVSPIGNNISGIAEALAEGRHGIRRVEEWGVRHGIETRLGGVVEDFDRGDISRKQRRTMGRVAEMSVAATRDAIADAGLDPDGFRQGQAALFYGSTDGSTSSGEGYYRKLYTTDSFDGLYSSMYLKFMSHTCAANLASVFGVRGRVVPICSACTSASQSIGEGYWSVRSGREEVAICGGAEELHFTVAGIFDLLLATSVNYNDRPDETPRPFDRNRDGLVVAEGAGTLILESWEHARKRGAHIHGEILGYGSNCDGSHPTSPSFDGMAGAMRRALDSAGMAADAIDYVNAHATATDVGDLAESKATHQVLGGEVPISSTKGHTGHTLGACGAIESIFCLVALRENFLPPTRNLVEADPRCAPLHHIMGDARAAQADIIMNNNFAFGGINTSLILGRV
jgi:3-oxoacyl-[acyl-carrier-protein] synthase II